MKITRRTVLAFTAATALAGSAVFSQATASKTMETRGIDDLYKASLKEGGRLVVYAGGDTPGQQDGMKKAFETRFPGVTLDIVVGYSKFHEPRVENQIATGKHVADVIQIQTLQNFPAGLCNAPRSGRCLHRRIC